MGEVFRRRSVLLPVLTRVSAVSVSLPFLTAVAVEDDETEVEDVTGVDCSAAAVEPLVDFAAWYFALRGIIGGGRSSATTRLQISRNTSNGADFLFGYC